MNKKILASLNAIPIFQNIPDPCMDALAKCMTTKKFGAGDNIVAEGEEGREMYILLEGEVRISKRTLDKEEYTVAMLREQDNPFFGELALLDHDKRSATITAISDCVLLALTREDFEQFGNEEPVAALAIMRPLAQLLTQRLRNSNQDIILLFEALVNEVRAKDIG